MLISLGFKMEPGSENEESQDSRPLTRDSNLMVLFDFTDFGPGIGLLCNIVKPRLAVAVEDALVLLNTYITSGRKMAIK